MMMAPRTWFSPSYSPQTGLIYQNVREKGAIYYLTEAPYIPGRQFLGASRRSIPGEEPWGAMRALNAMTGERQWEFRLQSPPWVRHSFDGRWCGLLR